MSEMKQAVAPTTARTNTERRTSYRKGDNQSSRLKEKIGEILLCLLADNAQSDGWQLFDWFLRQFYEGGTLWSEKSRKSIAVFMNEQWKVKAARQRCTLFVWSVAEGRLKRSLGVRRLNAHYIRIGQSPASHRVCLRAFQTNRNWKTQRIRAIGRLWRKKP